ncbi:MAG: glycosyl transferase family 1 [Cytophagaceae bacterium]|nr:glycosyl transferase family 1 [Cytophagaceae bacterium]|tara:strand:- start:4876 stop:6081 length:1206 start_codon:yes stop_codon:yes gene_type:complete
MKLAIVTAYPPSKVTLNEYAFHLVKSFRTNQEIDEVVIFTDVDVSKDFIEFDEEGCRVKTVKCWEFNSYFNVFNVLRAIRAEAPDAVLYNLQFLKFGDKKVPAALGLTLPYLTKKMGIPTIALMHNILEQVDLEKAGIQGSRLMHKAYNAFGTLLTKVLLKADRFAVTINKYVSTLEAKYNAKNVVLMPHGSFEVPAEPSYDLPAGPKKIMAFGKFGTYKKVESLIEAVEKIRERTSHDIELVIAGTNNPNAVGYLEGVFHDYKHVPQLRFTGYVEEEDVPGLFNESAVVVFPYTSTTGSSGVLHQAGSYGKACAMPDLGDLALLTQEEGYEAQFFEPDDSESMASALLALLDDDAHRQQVARANYKAATQYPMERIAQMYIDEFKQVMLEKYSSKFKLSV